MRSFWAILLSVLVGFAPVLPQYAHALPLRNAETEADSKDFDFQNSYEVVELGTEENPLKVLFINVREKKSMEKTLSEIKPLTEQALREHQDLRFLYVTIHPQDTGEVDESGNKIVLPVSHVFWRDNSPNQVTNDVADHIGISRRGTYSRENMLESFNRHHMTDPVEAILNYGDERNPNVGFSESFLKALTQTDINSLNFTRPRTDITTGLIRGAATGAGVASMVYFGTDAEASAMQVAAAASPPAIAAFLTGLWNQALADWEQNSKWTEKHKERIERLKEENREKARTYIREIEGYWKNTKMAMVHMMTLQLSLLGAHALGKLTDTGTSILHEPVTIAGFLGAFVLGTGRNVAKKTFLIRSLHRWTHEKYKEDPKRAAHYARVNAWLMALMGALITGTDTFQYFPAEYNMSDASIYVDVSLGLAGGATFFYFDKIRDGYKALRSSCSNLLMNTKIGARMAVDSVRNLGRNRGD